MSKNTSESFRWMPPEFKVNEAPGKKVIIRGPALFSVEKYRGQGISRNARKYVEDEIIRSARTLKGVEIDVNHEISTWEQNGQIGPKPHGKGHVLFGEEEDSRVEYAAEITDPIYREKVRDTDKVRHGKMTEAEYKAKWNKLPIRGVSVDAEFLKSTCTVTGCGKEFHDWNLFKKHMIEDHFQKNFEFEPHNIAFKRLSLVEPPEVPGVVGADFEIVETLDGMTRMIETLITEAYASTGEEKRSTKPSMSGPFVDEGPSWEKPPDQNVYGPGFADFKPLVDAARLERQKEVKEQVRLKEIDLAERVEKAGKPKIEPKIEEDLNSLYRELKARLPKEDQESWIRVVAQLDKSLLEGRKYLAEKESVEGLFAVGEKNIQETQNAWDSEKQKKQAALKALEEMNVKYQLSETEKEQLQIENDNLKDKLGTYSKFKGKNADVTKSQGTPSYNRDPYVKE